MNRVIPLIIPVSVATIVVLMLLACQGHHVPAPLAKIVRPQLPAFEHVFVVVEENQNYSNVIGNKADLPYLNSLADRYGVATNYFADTHPSINNYFILTAGRMGIRARWMFRDLSDLYPFEIRGENVASVLTDSGKSWKSYAESIPAAGYIGDDRAPYVKRHNPFAYFETVRESQSQRHNIVGFSEFKRDLENDSFPNYSFIVPNIFHDGHDNPDTTHRSTCGEHKALQDIDGWLKSNIDPLVQSKTFQRSGLLMIVFDEACEYGPHADGRYDPAKPGVPGGGHVAAIVVSSQTPSGTRSDKVYHHGSVLRLSLRAVGVERLPGVAADSPDMDEFFPAAKAVTGVQPGR